MVGILRGTLFLATLLGLILVVMLAVLRLEPSSAFVSIIHLRNSRSENPGREFSTALVDPNGKVIHRLHTNTWGSSIQGVTPNGEWVYKVTHDDMVLRLKTDASQTESFPLPESGFWIDCFSPDSQWIIYRSRTNENYDLYRMQIHGTNAKRLTNSQGDDFCSYWTPDSQWIIYINTQSYQHREIYRMRSDGSANLNLTNHPEDDEFGDVSADGQWVIFRSNRDGNDEIYRVRFDGTDMENLTNYPSQDNIEFISPDGKSIYFSSDRNGDLHLYRMKIDGTDIQQITNEIIRHNGSSMSPDGRWIIFRSATGVYKMRPDGSELVELPPDVDPFFPHFYSPDGKWYYSPDAKHEAPLYITRVRLEDGKVFKVAPSGIMLGFAPTADLTWHTPYLLVAWSTALLVGCARLYRRHRNA